MLRSPERLNRLAERNSELQFLMREFSIGLVHDLSARDTYARDRLVRSYELSERLSRITADYVGRADI